MTSKYRFHKFWNFNPSSDVIIAKIGSKDPEFRPFLSQFWVDDVTMLTQNFKILRKRFHKGIIHLRVSFTFDFHLSLNFLTQFWVNDVTTGVKTVTFCESDLRNKLVTSKFHQILISIFLSHSIHDVQLWALCTQFGGNDVTKEINILEFWKCKYLEVLKLLLLFRRDILLWNCFQEL